MLLSYLFIIFDTWSNIQIIPQKVDKHKESWYLKYCDVYSLYGCIMLQKLPAHGFKWVENTSQFNKDLKKNKQKKKKINKVTKCFFL